MRRWLLAGAATGFLYAGLVADANAAPALRVQVEQKGDFALIGNTLGHECRAGTPAPIVGTVGNCGINVSDTSPDVFWRSESPGAGQAEANTGITAANARSTAVLSLPAGASVTHAYLYWSATRNTAGADDTVSLDRPGTSFTQNVTATQTFIAPGNAYSGVSDITSIVQAQGPGPYRVSGVEVRNVVNVDNETSWAGWWMVVLYTLPTDPPRNLALFDGLDRVGNGAPQNVTLSGFLVPPAFGPAKLGVVALEGEASIPGDQFFFNGGAALSDAVNSANDFFNASRSLLGSALTVPGDLPQLTGGSGSMSGLDIDVVDITNKLTAGLTSAPIQATSSQDAFYLATFVTSIPAFKPDFSSSGKTAVDVNGGALLPGDVVEYTVVATNDGNDTAINTRLEDKLPAGVTFVPGSIQITAGANAGAKTDATGDDQCQFAAGTVTCHLGEGATASQGGTMIKGASTTIKFSVTIDAGASGTIENQAIINAAGQQGAPAVDTPTDGNGNANGNPPTPIVVDGCLDDTGCQAPKPFCKTTSDPNVCVECLLDNQCPAAKPVCEAATSTCICVPSGAESCDGKDNDCNGTVDDGFSVGSSCANGVGECSVSGVVACVSDTTAACNAVPGTPQTELCDGKDNDCNGTTDDGFNIATACTNGVGACAVAGVIACVDTSSAACNAVAGTPGPFELCGDAIDSDCDGNNDNGCNVDTDSDGLPDAVELQLGLKPTDADSDDDGVIDGQEPSLELDSDKDGLINALDPDSDNDGLFDGTELGLGCGNAATDAAAANCIADADSGATKTNPLDADSDDGGVLDGVEDINRNGAVDTGETDPNLGSDDNLNVDSDGDGLSYGFEVAIGTDPADADSDDDGVLDGQEANLTDDTDKDGIINALDFDSDGDGLFDGTETGRDCANAATDMTKNHCVADADPATTTSMVNADTDKGGVNDGTEDANHNGMVDAGEKNPLDPADDDDQCKTDAECGSTTSGKVCDANLHCVDGCRGTGNGCPSGQVCSSADETIGTCSQAEGGAGGSAGSGGSGTGGSAGKGGAAGAGGSDAGTDSGKGGSAGKGGNSGKGGSAGDGTGGSAAADAGPEGPGSLEGGGCACSTPRSSNDSGFAALLAAFGLTLTAIRRKR